MSIAKSRRRPHRRTPGGFANLSTEERSSWRRNAATPPNVGSGQRRSCRRPAPDSSDTGEGRHAHRRVNRDGGKLPPPDEVGESPRLHARSVTLSSVQARDAKMAKSRETLVVSVDDTRLATARLADGAPDRPGAAVLTRLA